ncbi:TrmH family RNA methyltransferase [Plebeiibacterium marinum]|uniref:RNA methyltransferase n=1 Tax=Plebeiibacterium marinum TaxID=2992111 RepID=A0AAE3SHW6_9BACT|nr:RNA methyltransferase [Plebeiobacterium marinum]MCW3804110.1 RNA methyltransferase [Plebeiobacterium marinum]
MISQSKIKLINSLSKKKYRDLNQLFIAEGEKLVGDIVNSSINIKWIFATKNWIDAHKEIKADEIQECDLIQLKKISQLKNPSPVVAICKIPSAKHCDSLFGENLTIALDDIQDPGNLGTIIRLADWFGVDYIVCSNNTADAFNPKVVQATMGAISRVKVIYTNLEEFIKEAKSQNIAVYGTFLDGTSIYEKRLSGHGIIVMGNEGKGISPKIENLISDKLLIPSFSLNQEFSESLNVSTATAITLSEFRRRI